MTFSHLHHSHPPPPSVKNCRLSLVGLSLGCNPLDGVTRGRSPTLPSDATARSTEFIFVFHFG